MDGFSWLNVLENILIIGGIIFIFERFYIIITGRRFGP